jgi:hypothetical protein
MVQKAGINTLLPAGYSWRELWDFKATNGLIVPSLVRSGHPLTLTNGMAKRTTCDGVHFTGAATSYINCGAIHDLATTLWMSFRFKLDTNFVAATPRMNLFGKWVLSNYIQVVIETGNTKLYWLSCVAGVNKFTLSVDSPTPGTWVAGQWYHVLVSMSAVNGARLRIDNGVAQTSANTDPISAIGTFQIGNLASGTSGAIGVISDFFCGTDDLTLTEEADLYRGIPPADAVHVWTLDEGRGITAYDRGSAPANGTLGSACKWAQGKTDLACLSPDGIDSYAISSSGVNLAGAVTFVWAGKLKALYSTVSNDHYLFEHYIDNNNYYQMWLNFIAHDFRFMIKAAGTTKDVDLTGFTNSIDDYAIFIATSALDGTIKLYANGILHDTATGAPVMPVGAAQALIGAEDSPAYYDVSKPVIHGLINGALSDREVYELSKEIDQRFKLGIGV